MMNILKSKTIAVIAVLILSGCAVPRHFWPQKDLTRFEMGDRTSDKKVLIASRYSEFKDDVLKAVKHAFEDKPVYIKFTGLEDLAKEDASMYSVVVIINTCMAWGMDPKVDVFLATQKYQKNIIVLTTSGEGNWLPDLDALNIDAMASASSPEKVFEISSQIIERIQAM